MMTTMLPCHRRQSAVIHTAIVRVTRKMGICPSFTASTLITSRPVCFCALAVAYIFIHLFQPLHILLITMSDPGVNPLMEMTTRNDSNLLKITKPLDKQMYKLIY